MTLEEKGSNNTNTDRQRDYFSKPVQTPWEPEIVREWRKRNPDAKRPTFGGAVKIAGEILDGEYLGPDPISPSDWRSFFRGLEMGEITRYAVGGSRKPIARLNFGIP